MNKMNKHMYTINSIEHRCVQYEILLNVFVNILMRFNAMRREIVPFKLIKNL